VDDVTGLLAAVELAVFSSRSELFGRGATEPMSVGLPVVGTDVPGIREAVGDVGAPFLAPPGDDETFAKAVVTFARDPALRARVGGANAELMKERQSADVTWKQYAKLVASVLAGHGHHSSVALKSVPR
jgi:glycosyltransferase involved in cell wall biosynthesis